MKRIEGLEDIAAQAGRWVDPLTGRLCDRQPAFDPRLVPTLDSPIAPWVQQLIAATVNEAIQLDLPLRETLDRLAASLRMAGIVVTPDDLQRLTGLRLSPALA